MPISAASSRMPPPHPGAPRQGREDRKCRPDRWRVLTTVVLATFAGCLKSPAPKDPQDETKPTNVEVELMPAVDELLARSHDQYKAHELTAARATLGKILVTHPQHLEARVLLAMVAEKAGDAGAAGKAWTEVERILVYQGKLAPFALQTTLYAAARYYVEADRALRARLFFDELWRRFPTGEWSPKAQLMLAETEFSRKRWTLVVQACRALARLRPKHRSLGRCKQLQVAARRMLEVAPQPTPGARRWVWEHPRPQGNTLLDVWVDKDGTLVAVGEAGTILMRSGRERQPRLVDSPVRWPLRGVWGTGANNVYAVGAAGVVLHHDGSRWQVVRRPQPEEPDLLAVFTAGPGQAVAVGERGTVLRLEAGRWSVSHPATVTLRGVWGPRMDQLYAVGDGGLLLRSTGGRWQTVRSDSYEDLWGVCGEKQDVFVVGNRKTVVRVTDGRAKESVIGRGSFRDVWGFPGGGAWAVGLRGESIRFDGKRWHSEPTGCLMNLHGVAGQSPTQMWAVGDGGTLLERRGRGWTRAAGGLQQDLVAAAVAGGEALALGQRGMLLKRNRRGDWRQAGNLPLLGTYRDLTTSGSRWVAVGDRGLMVVREGTRWERVSTNTPEDLRAVYSSEGTVVAVGTRGSIIRLVGDAVVRDRPPTGLDLHDVWGDGRTLYAVGTRGVMLKFDGEHWTELQTGVLADLHGVWGVSPQRVIAVGEGGTILSLERGRFSRHSSPISQTLQAVWGTEEAIYAVARNGGVIRHDGGAWRVDDSPAACLTTVTGDPTIGVLAVGCHGSVLRLKP